MTTYARGKTPGLAGVVVTYRRAKAYDPSEVQGIDGVHSLTAALQYMPSRAVDAHVESGRSPQ